MNNKLNISKNPINQLRADEFLVSVSFERTNRIILENRQYSYKTREGDTVGPFSTEAEAKYDMNQFIELAGLEKEFRQLDFQTAA